MLTNSDSRRSAGFCNHEVIIKTARIHMNGRVYDPNLGRFLSVDPVFEFPTNTQSLNPYSYVLNNPLSLTDPTGYTAEGNGSGSCAAGESTCAGQSQGYGQSSGESSRIAEGHRNAGSEKLDHLGRLAHFHFDQNTAVKAVQFENGATFGHFADDAQNKPTDTAGIGSQNQISKNPSSAGSEVPPNPDKAGGSSNSVSKAQALKNLANAKNIFWNLYARRGEMNPQDKFLMEDYSFVAIDGGESSDAFQTHYSDTNQTEVLNGKVTDTVAHANIQDFRLGISVSRGGADTLLGALDTYAHEVYHFNPQNIRAWSSGNKYEMGGAQAAAVGHAHIVTELYKKYRETFDLPK